VKRSEVNEVKRSKVKAKEPKPPRPKTSSPTSLVSHLTIYDNLCQHLKPATKSDETAFRRLAKYLAFDNSKAEQVMALAKEATGSKARNKIALFISMLKKEIGYESNRLGAVGVQP
jgi:hypothetical protein